MAEDSSECNTLKDFADGIKVGDWAKVCWVCSIQAGLFKERRNLSQFEFSRKCTVAI